VASTPTSPPTSVVSPTALGPIIACASASAIAIWITWFLTHLPWLQLSERTSIPSIIAVWFVFAILVGAMNHPRIALKVGIGAELLAAVIGLLLLGSKLVEAAPDQTTTLRPNVVLIVSGFLLFGAIIGFVGAMFGRGLAAKDASHHADWLGRQAIITAIAVAPLLFIGGLVTSTNSGMAVPDWPNTYGSNMFLYPLGPRTGQGVFLEHAHRLFGTLIGCISLMLMVWVLIAEPRRWVRAVAVVAFVLVCLQGVLGGVRVRMGHVDPERDLRFLAAAHGVLAQITFGLLVALAVFLSPTFKTAQISTPLPANSRRLRFLTAGLLHSTILQLAFGAMYRHLRDMHSLWTHAAFSIVVLLFAVVAGFSATAVAGELGGIGPVLRRCGRWLVGVVALQFLLGWATFGMGGGGLQAETGGQALLRTAHQANGALLLALAVLAFIWTRRMLRQGRTASVGPIPAP
jgi:cytochrome c oxidase assembly protein subunit 15